MGARLERADTAAGAGHSLDHFVLLLPHPGVLLADLCDAVCAQGDCKSCAECARERESENEREHWRVCMNAHRLAHRTSFFASATAVSTLALSNMSRACATRHVTALLQGEHKPCLELPKADTTSGISSLWKYLHARTCSSVGAGRAWVDRPVLPPALGSISCQCSWIQRRLSASCTQVGARARASEKIAQGCHQCQGQLALIGTNDAGGIAHDNTSLRPPPPVHKDQENHTARTHTAAPRSAACSRRRSSQGGAWWCSPPPPQPGSG